MTTTQQPLDNALSLMLFTQRFATCINSGVSLVSSLAALETSDIALGGVVRDIDEQVQAGHTLSGALARHPEIFSALYVGMVRAGEIGGVLDITLQRLANLMLKEWRLMRRRPTNETPFLLLAPSAERVASWAELTPYQQTVTLIMFYETFGMLLSSGVPILQSIESTSVLLPQEEAEQLLRVVPSVRNGDPLGPTLATVSFVTPLVTQLLEVGERVGALDLMLLKAAALYEFELDCRWPDDLKAFSYTRENW